MKAVLVLPTPGPKQPQDPSLEPVYRLSEIQAVVESYPHGGQNGITNELGLSTMLPCASITPIVDNEPMAVLSAVGTVPSKPRPMVSVYSRPLSECSLGLFPLQPANSGSTVLTVLPHVSLAASCPAQQQVRLISLRHS